MQESRRIAGTRVPLSCSASDFREVASAASVTANSTTDKLTDPQIVAKVKDHFGIVR